MSTGAILTGFDPSTLLSYYQSRLPTAPSAGFAASAARTAKSATANDAPPWEAKAQPQESRDADVLATKNFLDLGDVPLNGGTTADAKTEQDNQKLFALYNAVNNLSYLASMSKRDGMTAGQLSGFNARFQDGLQQIRDYVAKTSFNNFTLQSATPSASTTSAAGIAFGSYSYETRTLTGNSHIGDALPGLDPSQSFTVSVKKAGVTTDVPIDLSQVNGTLSLDNVISYVNQQLSAAGFSSRFHRTITKGTIDEPKNASYGMEVAPAGSETLTLSAASSAPALYVAGNSGIATASGDTAADRQGRLIKLTDLDGSQQSAFSATAKPSSGLTTAQATVVDAGGNVYVVGNATGDADGNQVNQGDQDTYLTKYDSAGNAQWTRLLGSAGTASAYGLALNPGGGVVVVGSTTGTVMTTAVADGNADSFVAKYDANGNESWAKQIQTLATNQAASVSVDASGNVYVGGQVKGVVGRGQTNNGGHRRLCRQARCQGQRRLRAAIRNLRQRQRGGDGADLRRRAGGGERNQRPCRGLQIRQWRRHRGAAVAAGSGGAAAGRRHRRHDGRERPHLRHRHDDQRIPRCERRSDRRGGELGRHGRVSSSPSPIRGATASADTVSYVGTGASDKGNAVTVGADGTIYLAGTTGGTFAGQTRNVAGADNMFVSALAGDGTVRWTRQYGGADGNSSGQGVAFDSQGASVLDALGLPRGTLSFNQTVDLTQSTTLREGDSFSIRIASTTTRTAKVTIQKGETLTSLVRRINIELQNAGKASVAYGSGKETLKIAVNSGVTATLIAGPANTDALSRLGLQPQTLTDTSDAPDGSSAAVTAYGLGLPQNVDISTASGGGAARAQLLNVLSAIQKIYQSENKPAASPMASSQASGPPSPQTAAQLANYTLALNMLSGSPSSAAGLF